MSEKELTTDAAIQYLESIIYEDFAPYTQKCLLKVIEVAREVEPETAEWIMDEIERDPIIQHGKVYRNYSTTFRCSKCNSTFAGSNLYFNYCPYCGKKMGDRHNVNRV